MPVWAIVAWVSVVAMVVSAAVLGARSYYYHGAANDIRYSTDEKVKKDFYRLDRKGDQNEYASLILLVVTVCTVFATLFSLALFDSRWDEDHKVFCESFGGASYSKSGDACYYNGKDISPWKGNAEQYYVEQ